MTQTPLRQALLETLRAAGWPVDEILVAPDRFDLEISAPGKDGRRNVYFRCDGDYVETSRVRAADLIPPQIEISEGAKTASARLTVRDRKVVLEIEGRKRTMELEVLDVVNVALTEQRTRRTAQVAYLLQCATVETDGEAAVAEPAETIDVPGAERAPTADEMIAIVESTGGTGAIRRWTRGAKDRLYFQTIKLNGGRNWNGGEACRGLYLDLKTGAIHAPLDGWAGSQTRKRGEAILESIEEKIGNLNL